MSKPRLLDLFCGQGGAAAGYIAAGFAVVGVDLADHSKRYPAAFVRGNAMTLLEDARFVRQFDAIHTSPPCQGYSIATAGNPTPAREPSTMPRSKAVQQRLLGIDWMTVRGMQESIPPVYAQYVGLQLLAHLEQVAA
jgi:DNA (cytosine-5)-methyltransferase 1